MFNNPKDRIGLLKAPRRALIASSESASDSQEDIVFLYIQIPQFLVAILKWLRPQATHNTTLSPSFSTPTLENTIEADSGSEEASLDTFQFMDGSLWDNVARATPASEDTIEAVCEPDEATFDVFQFMNESLWDNAARAIPNKHHHMKILKRQSKEEPKKVKKTKAPNQILAIKLAKKRQQRAAKEERRANVGISTTLTHHDIEPKVFPGNVLQLPKRQGKKLASNLCSYDRDDTLIFWTDGSIDENPEQAGAAVAYKDKTMEDESNQQGWKELGWRVSNHIGHTGHVELVAIAGALEVAAVKVMEHSRTNVHSVVILTDSDEAIRRCSSTTHLPTHPLDWQIQKRAQQLVSLGTNLSLFHVPGHSGVEGNCRAHQAARAVAKETRSDIYRGSVSVPRTMDELANFRLYHEWKTD
ncbi:hypothetical protein F66182_7996 [Fusarium sp. NRRL 66182]|nr:hypothetical protein F66182_7996 [Fusarium sp. NRRL 66182]